MTTRFEHVALNLSDYQEAVRWYTRHLGLTVVRDDPGVKVFLGDSMGRTVLELYTNTEAGLPDYTAMHYFSLHIAFAVEDPDESAAALVNAGAVMLDPPRTASGDRLAMVRDPWGVCLQLIHRNEPMP
ncbi:MAG: VOC family protein [Spirochaetaceae bacterium]